MEKQAWNLAKSPMGSVAQTMFMFWMSGSSVSIFTIMITVQFLTSPLMAISNVNAVFTPFVHKDINLLLPKLAYIALNIGLFIMALWKLSVLGVIPVTPYDWISVVSTRTSQE